MKGLFTGAVLVIVAVSCVSAQAAVITGVSIPVGSMDAYCHPRNSGVWSVSAPPYPLNIGSGIGNIINPAGGGLFSMHDHGYSSSYIPAPSRAVVTYEFNTPAVVDQIQVFQHTNGITKIEGFVGNSLSSLTSIGAIFGPSGDITGSGKFSEHAPYLFDFNNAVAGKYLQVVIRKTSLHNGWASYQIYPRDANGRAFAPIPEPASMAVVLVGAGALLRRRRRLG